MDQLSPLRSNAKYQSTFKENKESYGLRRKSGYSSPVLDIKRFKGLLSLGKVNLVSAKPTNEPDFYEELAKECQKLDPDFEVPNDKANCYKLILEIMRKAINLILTEGQKDLRIENFRLKNENSELKTQKDESFKKWKQISERDDGICQREDRLRAGEIKLVMEQKVLQAERSQINSSKKYYFQLEAEVKLLRENLKSQEKMIRTGGPAKFFLEKMVVNSLNKVPEKIDMLSLTSGLKNIVKEDEITDADSDKSGIKSAQSLKFFKVPNQSVQKEALKVKSEIEIGREELENHSKLLQEATEALKKEKYQFQKEVISLKKERKLLESDKKYILEFQETICSLENELLERETAVQLKELYLKDKIDSEEAWKNLDDEAVDLSKNSDLAKLFLNLQRQVDFYHQELSEKEYFFKDREEKLNNQEKQIEKKIIELRTIQKTLKNSEVELMILKNETIPRLETQSANVKVLLNDLYKKKQDLNSEFKKVHEERFLLEKSKKEYVCVGRYKKFESIFQEIVKRIEEVTVRQREIQTVEATKEDFANLEVEIANYASEKKSTVEEEDLLVKICIQLQYLQKVLDAAVLSSSKKLEELSI